MPGGSTGSPRFWLILIFPKLPDCVLSPGLPTRDPRWFPRTAGLHRGQILRAVSAAMGGTWRQITFSEPKRKPEPVEK